MYKFISKERPECKISETVLKEFEKEYEIKFPEALRKFYLEYHASDIEECSLILDHTDEEFIVVNIIPLNVFTHRLNTLLDTRRSSIEYYSEKGMNKLVEIKQNYIPFADDYEDYKYYWNTNDGKVYFINELFPENPFLICDSVDEFFELMNESCE